MPVGKNKRVPSSSTTESLEYKVSDFLEKELDKDLVALKDYDEKIASITNQDKKEEYDAIFNAQRDALRDLAKGRSRSARTARILRAPLLR